MLRNCFCRKALPWAHKLTKSRRKAWHRSLHFVSVSFALSLFLLKSPCIPGRTELMENIIRTKGWSCSQGAVEPHRTDTPKEDNCLGWGNWVLWSRGTRLMGTRLLPSSEDRDNSFFETPCRTRTEMTSDQATLCSGLLNYAYLSPVAVLPPFKPKAHACTQTDMAEVLPLPFPMMCLSPIINLPSLPFTATCLFIWCIGVSSRTWHVGNLQIGRLGLELQLQSVLQSWSHFGLSTPIKIGHVIDREGETPRR
jgi:hypothetical protein